MTLDRAKEIVNAIVNDGNFKVEDTEKETQTVISLAITAVATLLTEHLIKEVDK